MDFSYNHTIFNCFCLYSVCLILVDFVEWVGNFGDFVGLDSIDSILNSTDVSFYFVDSVESLVDFDAFDFVKSICF